MKENRQPLFRSRRKEKEATPGKIQYYDPTDIIAMGATYMFVLGIRSNGKTYAALKDGLRVYKETRGAGKMAYIRRRDEELKYDLAMEIFSGLVKNGEIEKTTDGRWSNVYYKGRRWYFCNYDEDGKRELDTEPFCYGFSIENVGMTRGGSYTQVDTIIFDEVVDMDWYYPSEFKKFQNLISTIVRLEGKTRIWMLGNTVSKDCIYFKKMGLYRVKEMKDGDIDLYSYGKNSDLHVAVEFVGNLNPGGRESDKYFAFDDPELQMITGDGGQLWEIQAYPGRPYVYKPSDVMFQFFVNYNDYCLQGDVVSVEDTVFVYMQTRCVPFRDDSFFYDINPNPCPNYRRNILRPFLRWERDLAALIQQGKVFYEDNEIGDAFRTYLNWCKTDK